MKRITTPEVFAALLFAAAQPSALSADADWGYNPHAPKVVPSISQPRQYSEPPPEMSEPVEMTAGPAQSLPGLPGAPKTSPVPPMSIKIPVKSTVSTTQKTQIGKAAFDGSSEDKRALTEWLELFQLTSRQPLTDQLKSEIRYDLLKQIAQGSKAEVSSIHLFWPQAKSMIDQGQDQHDSFASLFRALLRFTCRTNQTPLISPVLVAQILGPERILLPGDPPLTDDAIDAYADMACFMYSQQNPGKSIDAVDNRAIFASVICNKYTQAPSPADKKAMANFALTWSKFKASWAIAGQERKEQLVASMQYKAAKPNTPEDELVDLILRKGPWSRKAS